MNAIVTVDAHTGTLRRYEIGGAARRMTHAASADQHVSFSPAVVEQFRTAPHPRFMVGPALLPSPQGSA